MIEFCLADDTELKTMIWSNPGLILIRNGVVIQHWHYNDFPGYETLQREYLNPAP